MITENKTPAIMLNPNIIVNMFIHTRRKISFSVTAIAAKRTIPKIPPSVAFELDVNALELAVVKFCVKAVLFHQGIVGTAFNDMTVFHYEDHIRLADC